MRLRALVVGTLVSVAAVAGCGGDDAPALPEGAPATEATGSGPTTEAPATDAPATEPPSTDAVTTEAPTTEAPSTDAPSTDAPGTDAPTTDAPTTEAPTSEAFQIGATVVGGQPDGGVRSYIVAVGTTVEITVVSDTADEGHLHGYDIEVALEPGVPETLTFTADMTGSFEFELHESGALLFYLDVA